MRASEPSNANTKRRITMQHKISRATVTIIGFAFLWANFALATEAKVCSLSRTAGKWGFTTNGTVVGVGPRVSLGIFTLDASGNLRNGKATASLNGAVTGEAFSGAYSVNSDCTGKLAVDVFDLSGNKAFTATLDLVFDEDVQELRGMFTSTVTAAGVALAPVIAVDARRIHEDED